MMQQEGIVALVPMRHHSDRVPGKNYRDLLGKPLYAYILETLQSVPAVRLIVVDTDSDVIADGLRRGFPEVELIERPEYLRGEGVPMNEVLRHDVKRIDGDLFLQTHSTNPLLEGKTISNAVELFLEVEGDYDSLFSVTRVQTRFWTPEGQPINHDPEDLIRTQDLPPYMEENSCFYVFRRGPFLERGNRIGQHPYLYEISPFEAVDIDEEYDFHVAECLMRTSPRVGT